MEEIQRRLDALVAGDGDWLTMTLVVLVAIAVVGWTARSWLRSNSDPETAHVNDRLIDPRRGWVQGASFILQRLHDNAYLEEDVIRSMLHNAWEISTSAELEDQVQRLVTTEKDAWGLLRAMLLLRSAVAVGWLENEASFERCFEVGVELQRLYGSWDELGDSVLRSRRLWRGIPPDGSGDDSDMKQVVEVIDWLKTTTWKKTAWQLPLQ